MASQPPDPHPDSPVEAPEPHPDQVDPGNDGERRTNVEEPVEDRRRRSGRQG